MTGGGSGIGKMIAAGFAQNGAKVYIAARKERQLKDVSSLQRKQQVRVKCFTVGRQWMTSTSQPFKKCSTLLQMLGYVLIVLLSYIRLSKPREVQGRMRRSDCRVQKTRE